jgi:hypothetical protein
MFTVGVISLVLVLTGNGCSEPNQTPTVASNLTPVAPSPAPNTFTTSGRVREPGASGISAVRVLETQSGKSTLTAFDGMYSIIGLTSTGLTSAHLTFEKDGYEATEIDAPPNMFSEIALQRVIRLTAGETVTPSPLAPHDLSYSVGAERCYPCRLVRVANSTPGMLQVRLTWTEASETLNLWAAGRRVDGTYPEAVAVLPISAGEVVVFVGMVIPPAETSRLYIPFTVAATIRSEP